MHRVLPGVLALTLMVSAPLGELRAAEQSPFTGTWTFNAAKSEGGTAPLPQSETRVYGTNLEGAVTIVVEGVEADGTSYAYGATGDLNGRSYPVVGRDVGARTLGDAISWSRVSPTVIQMTVGKKGQVINSTRHTLSGDGKTLTVSELLTNDQGAMTLSVKVFDRQ